MPRLIVNTVAFLLLNWTTIYGQDQVSVGEIVVSVPATDESGKKFGKWVGKKINGMLEGECKLLSNDNKILAVEYYKSGKEHGIRRSYYLDGKLFEEANYVNGQRHGLVKKYYPNSSIAKHVFFVRDTVHGEVRTFYQNGKVCVEGVLEMGVPVGNFGTYLNDGKLAQVEDNKEGKIVEKKVYAEPTPEQREEIRKVDEFSGVKEAEIWGLSSKVQSTEPGVLHK